MPLDVIFLLDSSSSISTDDYLIYKTWLADSIYQLVPETTRIGVAQFSTLMQVEFQLDDYELGTNTEEWQQRGDNYRDEIMALQRLGGLTRTQYALEQVRLQMWPRAESNRNHLMVIVTDGRPSFGQDPCEELELYSGLGIDYVLIGIGSEVEQYIDLFCSDAEILADLKANMVLITDFSALYGAENSIGNLLCPSGTAFDGYYDIGNTDTWLNGRPTYRNKEGSLPIFVYYDGSVWIFETNESDAEVLGYTSGDSNSLWPTGIFDWQYTDENGGVFVYSGGELVDGEVECTGTILQLYTVGGYVLGLPSETSVEVSLALGDVQVTSTTVAANSEFVFDINLPETYFYNVTIPSDPVGYRCSISNGQDILLADVDNVAIECQEIYDIIGTATNIEVPITITNGDTSLVLDSDGTWSMVDILDDGDSYNIEIAAQPEGYTCIVTNGVGTTNDADVTNVQVECIPIEDYDISGTVINLSGSVTLTNGGDSIVVNEDSPSWTIVDTVAHDTSYEVTVTKNPPGYTCTVASGATGIAQQDITGVAVACTQNQYTVSGDSVTVVFEGLTDGDITLCLNNDRDGLITVPGGTSEFEFPAKVVYGQSYIVTVAESPPGQTCSISNGLGTVTGDIDNVSINCVPDTYSVGGEGNTIPVSGLSDGVVQVSINGGDPISISGSDQDFTFDAEFTYGDSYSVEIVSQPVGQTCEVSNENGVVLGQVTNVAIDCTLNEHTVEGTSETIVITGLTDGTVGISLNGGEAISVSGNQESFIFPNTVSFGEQYEVTVTQQPEGQMCTISNGSGTISGNIDTVEIDCVPNVYSIGGEGNTIPITGLTDGVVQVSLNGEETISVAGSEQSFAFTTGLNFGDDYEVTIASQPVGQLCVVSHGVGTTDGHISNVAIDCTLNPYTAGGSSDTIVIEGLTDGKVGLSLNGGPTVFVTGGKEVDFVFPNTVNFGDPYEVAITEQPIGQTCTLENGSGIALGNIDTIEIACDPNVYSIGGEGNSISIPGFTDGVVVVSLNEEETVSITGSEQSFSFNTVQSFGDSYSVTVVAQPVGQTCLVSNGVGVVTDQISNIAIDCSLNTYSVEGSSDTIVIEGLTDGTIGLSLNGGDSIFVTGDEDSFVFPNAVTFGDSYAVTVTHQPEGQMCTIQNASGVTVGNVGTIEISCVPNAFSIGGEGNTIPITGLTNGVVVLALNGEETVSVSGSEQSFSFSGPQSFGDTYVVTVETQPVGQTCVVQNGSGTVTTHITDVAIECTLNEYSVEGSSGTVVIEGLTDGTIGLSLNGGDSIFVTGEEDSFTFPNTVTFGDPYEVTITTQPDGQVCSMSNSSGTTVGNVDTIEITCIPNAYSIGGEGTTIPISGLTDGVVVVSLNGEETVSVTGSDQSFSFDTVLGYGDDYSVSVLTQPVGQTCTVSNGEGSVSGHVNDISINCILNEYTVEGSSDTIVIEGLTDGTVGLSLNGGTTIFVTGNEDAFVFPNTVVFGDPYDVKVTVQPEGQTCTLVNGSGTTVGNVDTIDISCVPITHTIGGEGSTNIITGLTDGVVQVSLNGGTPISIQGSDQSFSFSEELNYGSDYSITVVSQPEGQTCVVTNGEGTIIADIDFVLIDCELNEHTVQGTSDTLVIEGLTDGTIGIALNGGDTIFVTGDDDSFSFPNAVTFGKSYQVTVTEDPVGQTCTVENGSGTIVADIDTVVITCVGNEHNIEGTITGLDGNPFTDPVAVTIRNTINGNVVETVTIPEQSSSFSFANMVTYGDNYVITVAEQPDGYECTIGNGAGTISGDVVNIALICSETGLVELGGTYSSTIIDGLSDGSLTIESNGISVELSAGENLSFNFGQILRYNEPYDVTVTENPTGQTCEVINDAGTAFDDHILNVRIDCTLNQHTVSGDISGLQPGQTVTIKNGGETITIDDSFTFGNTVEFGGSYDISITDEPDGVDCSLLNPSGTVTSDVTDVVVICDIIEVTIGGDSETLKIEGLTEGHIVLVLNGDEELIVSGGSTDFAFNTPLTWGDTYEVTVGVQPPGQTCTVSNPSGTVTDVGVTNVAISCVEHEYVIGGTVEGITTTEWLTQMSAIAQNTVTGEAYLIRETTEDWVLLNTQNYGDTYDLVMLVQPTGHTCAIEPSSGTVTANIENIVVSCTQNLVNVGGLSSSLVIDGLTDGEIVIALNGEETTIQIEGGQNNGFNFENALSYNEPYEITIVENPEGQTCVLNSAATGVATTVDITSVLIACSANPYTVGGTVTGLENGQGTVTLNLGGVSIVASGDFTFPDEIDFGQSYDVTVSNTPEDYDCVIVNSNGVVSNDITDINVSCIAHPTMAPTTDSPSKNPVTPPPSVSPSKSPIRTPRPSYAPSLSPTFSECNPYDLYYETIVDEPDATTTSMTATSVQHCGNICREILENCDAFQYEVETGKCTIFQTGEVGVHDNVNFVFNTPGFVSGWGRCDAERADFCQLTVANISRVNGPHFYVHEAGFNPEDPNSLRFLVEVHPSYFNILLGFDNATSCGSNYTVEIGHPYENDCITTRWRAIERLNGSDYCDNELYQLDVPFWDFVVGGEGGVRVMESYTDEFGVVHDDPNYYYLGFILDFAAKQPLRQFSEDRVWEEIRDVYDAVPMVIRLERTAQASTAIVVFLGDYDYITVGAVVEHVSVVNNYGFQAPYGSSRFLVRTRSQYPYMFVDKDGATKINLDTSTAKNVDGIVQTAESSIQWLSEEGICEWTDGNPWSDVCDQIWEINLQPDYCYIDGDYVVEFEATCFRNKTCEIPDGQTGYIRMTFKLESTNFCPVVVDEVGLQGALYFTGTENYNKEDKSYAIFADDTVFFRSEVFSPEAAIQNSTIISIVATWEANDNMVSVHIWDQENPEDDLGLVPYYPSKFAKMEYIDLMPFDYGHFEKISNRENGFSFVVDRRVFPLKGDGIGTLTVTCTVAITYEGGLTARRRLSARRNLENEGLPQTHSGDLNLKISGPAIGVTRQDVFLPYDETHVHQGSVHFYIQIRLQKDVMAQNRLDAGKLLHVLKQVILEFSHMTEDGFNLDRVDACEPNIMRPGFSSWSQCDTLFADSSLLGVNTDYMPLSRTGLHYVDKNVLQIWGTFIQSAKHPEPMRNWNTFQNVLVDVDSPFYGTSLFHSSTLVEAQARDAPRPMEEENTSSTSDIWVFINVLTIFTVVFTI